MEEQNYQYIKYSNQIDITTPEGIEEVKKIFDEQNIDPQVPPDSDKEQVWVSGTLNTFLITHEDTNGEYSVIDSQVPIKAGPITHIHNHENEVFKILDGTVSFQYDNQIKIANPGDIIFVPEGHLHAFKNLGNKPARMLTFATPSGIEEVFREGGEPVTDPSQPPPKSDPAKIQAALIKYDTDIFPEANIFEKPPITDGGQVFYGNEYSETITGSNGSDIILGRNGNDRLVGILGNDTLIGGTSDDRLDGGEGDDLLSAREGNDTLVGGFGKDTLTGGKGSDIFLFESVADSDTVTDFKDYEDLIGLSGGLTFADLKIAQGMGDNANDTLISLASSNETLAILSGVQASTITSDDFHLV